MDSRSLPPQPTMIPIAIQTATTITNHLNNPDSTNSSPRSHQIDSWDEPLPPVPGAKLRLMCSYGGHIFPRPHDNSLCYIGGDTRIVVVDRHASLSDLHSRLFHTLLNGRQFTLKYQLPSEDLDSLVSITTDEDLENMLEEYDRIISTSPLKPSRLRLFLFPAKPETAASMGCLLNDAKSETWFVDTLNGGGLLPRGLSDSAANIDNLMELDGPQINRGFYADIEAQNLSSDGNDKQVITNVIQDVQSTLSDPPMIETTSSFDSSVSSPSVENLPPIKLKIEDTNARLEGKEEQFSQMNVVANALPSQPVTRKHGDRYSLPSPDSELAGGYNLPSPDSVASDSSSACLSKYSYQDGSLTTIRENRISPAVADSQSNITAPSPLHLQQVPEITVLPASQQNQQQQQQFIQTSAHYIQHPATGQVPISSYYSVYAPPRQEAIHQQIDQQHPMYFLPVSQTQRYNLIAQDATSVAASRSLTPQNSTFISSNAYKQVSPTIYQPKTITLNPEMAANLYRTAGTAAATLVQAPAKQFQQQYFGLSQIPPPSQSIPAASASATNYGYEYVHQMPDHAYYAQHPTATLPQYQPMVPASALMLSQTSTELAADNTSQEISSSR